MDANIASWSESVKKINDSLDRMDRKLNDGFSNLITGLKTLNTKLTPYKVLFCCNKTTAVQFEEVVTMELKRLPFGAIVLHEDGSFAAELATQLHINTEMVDIKEFEFSIPNLVLVFHPDIAFDEKTKKIVTKSWKANVPVYVHDLKRKSKFEGDFNIL